MPLRMGIMGTGEPGWGSFNFVTDVTRSTTGRSRLTSGFCFEGLGCYEFLEEATGGIDSFIGWNIDAIR